MNKKKVFVGLLVMIFFSLLNAQKKRPHVVFVTGDEEYRSEESMPMLARILSRELNAKVTVCYAMDSLGNINPNINNNITGLHALKTADLMVVFTRWRELPKEQAKWITDFAESGKPMVGFRTSTHTFKYNKDSSMMHLNDKWPYEVWGQQWITHHGHFDDGGYPLTEVSLVEKATHRILRGVKPFQAYSWLYHVDGGEWKINPNCRPILKGRSLKSQHEMNGDLAKFPLYQSVAWTKSYTTKTGKTSRIFFTTLGHPFDFKEESMRKLAINGIFWALGKEFFIPKNGVNVNLATPYEPNNSGFGEKFKKDLKPLVLK
jgi:uncharacterized protein